MDGGWLSGLDAVSVVDCQPDEWILSMEVRRIFPGPFLVPRQQESREVGNDPGM